ncbi:MAG: phosphatidate cytidylyltransferase [Burkholderiales bacterium]|nr:phosphatidate cytidylyltransferase [Bacteroidia bacterium]
MKNKFSLFALCMVLLLSLQSCEIVGGIFKAGITTGVIMVTLVVAFIIFLIFRMSKRK